MWVVAPFTTVNPETRAALDATGWEYEPVDVSGSDRAYFDLLSGLWDAGASFAVVEHDIVVHPSALDELHDCHADWCGFPHRYFGEIQYGLGCVKFTDRLIARNPDAMRKVGVMSDANHRRRHWCRLDAWLQAVILPGAGERKCRHETVLEHLGAGSAHGCTK